MFEEEPVDFSKALRKDKTQKDSGMSSKCEIKKENGTIPESETTISNDDFDDIFKEELVDFSTLREGSSYQENSSQEAEVMNASHSSSPQDKIRKNIPSFLSQFSYKSNEAEDKKVPPPLKSADNAQAQESTLTKLFSYNSKEKRGVQFSESDSETEKNSSSDQYEQILLRKRELKESGWIDARKMKKKLKSAFSK